MPEGQPLQQGQEANGTGGTQNQNQGGNESQAQRLNLAAIIADPSQKAILDAYVEETTRPLRTALESHKQFKERYKVGEDDNGHPIYMDPSKPGGRNAADKQSTKDGGSQQRGDRDRDGDRGRDSEKSLTDEIDRAVQAKEQSINERIVNPLKQQLESQENFIRSLMIDSSLASELERAGVKPALRDAAKLLLNQNFSIEKEGDARVVVVKDKDGQTRFGANGRMTIEEFVASWADTEQGKAFVVAPTNTGGGSGNARPTSTSGYQVAGKRIGSRADLNGYEEEGAFIKQYGRDAFYSLPHSK